MTETKAMAIEDADALLALVPQLGMSDGKVEEAAGLAQAFLAKARKREKRDPRSAGSWARLRALLVTKLGPEAVDAALAPVRVAPAPAVPAAVVAELIASKITNIKTHAQRAEVEKELAAAVVRGSIDRKSGEIGLKALHDLGRALDAEAEERARAELQALELLDAEEAEWLEARRAGESQKRQVAPPVPPADAVSGGAA